MENEKHRNYSFQKLTPYEKADMEGYDQSLSFAFQKGNEDLRNSIFTDVLLLAMELGSK